MNANCKKYCNFGANYSIDNDRIFFRNNLFAFRHNNPADVYYAGIATHRVGVGFRI